MSDPWPSDMPSTGAPDSLPSLFEPDLFCKSGENANLDSWLREYGGNPQDEGSLGLDNQEHKDVSIFNDTQTMDSTKREPSFQSPPTQGQDRQATQPLANYTMGIQENTNAAMSPEPQSSQFNSIDPQLYGIQGDSSQLDLVHADRMTQDQSQSRYYIDSTPNTYAQYTMPPHTYQMPLSNTPGPSKYIYPPVPRNGFGSAYCYPAGSTSSSTIPNFHSQYHPQHAGLPMTGYCCHPPPNTTQFGQMPSTVPLMQPVLSPPQSSFYSSSTIHVPQDAAAPAYTRNRASRHYGLASMSPLYLSDSDFELCPDIGTEGLPDSRNWHFVSGKRISASRKDNMLNRLKQLSKCYGNPAPAPASWGTKGRNGKPLFTYTKGGRWTAGRKYTVQNLEEYIEKCPRELFIWVQQSPAQSNWRMDEDDNLCRWDCCPVRSRKIRPGWLRVAFDEFGMETSTGLKDPFKVAGVMHLWCFEQCFDLVKLYSEKKLFADIRNLPLEELNRMSLAKDTDKDIMDKAFRPWFQCRLATIEEWASVRHEDSLSYALVKHHLAAQTSARQLMREARNAARPAHAWKTLDVHMGDLGLYTGLSAWPGEATIDEILETVQNDCGSLGHSAAIEGADAPQHPSQDLVNFSIKSEELEAAIGTDWQDDYNFLFGDSSVVPDQHDFSSPRTENLSMNESASTVGTERDTSTTSPAADGRQAETDSPTRRGRKRKAEAEDVWIDRGQKRTCW